MNEFIPVFYNKLYQTNPFFTIYNSSKPFADFLPTTDKYIFSLMYFPLTLHTPASSPQSPYSLPAFCRTAAALPRRLL